MLDLVALFDEYEHLLLLSPAVTRFSLLKRRVLERKGYIRARAELVGGGLLEFSEFWTDAAEGEPVRQEYAYHWQNAEEQLVRRWDNVNHHPHLPFAPHHAHLTNDQVEGVADPPDLAAVLREIEGQLGYT